MNLLEFSGLVFIIAYLAGIVGALAGLGGGIVIIPALVLLLHVNIYYAMGAALISVLVTSSGAAVTYLREGYTNLRIGIFLETAAVIGALIGVVIITYVTASTIAIIFGAVLLGSSYLAWRRKEIATEQRPSHPWAAHLQLAEQYPVHNVPGAWIIMFFAGVFASLLGIGSGALKVLAMDQAMHLPYKVSTATSNFIIGITAAVSAAVYFSRGYIDPVLSFPVAVGVLVGSMTGAVLLKKLHVKVLRIFFSLIILALGLQMIYKGFTGVI